MAKKGRGIRRKLLMLLCLAVFFACLGALTAQLLAKLQGERAQADMQEMYYGALGLGARAEEMPIVEDAHLAAPEPDEAFSRLLEANPDTVGWLKAGEIIDSAVVQRDNEYYLTHNFFCEATAEGTAFMDEGCAIWPTDQHLIIHGHNMRNGNVFGRLRQFRDLDYLRQNGLIEFNTLYRADRYAVVAVFDISAEPGYENYMDLQQFQFSDDAAFDAFVQDAQRRSYFDIPLDVNGSDRLLSLVTCSYFDVNGRLVVMFRALRPDEDAQEVSQRLRQATAR